ncbi:MAG: class I SAM-dependent methyltransferase [Brumimicrobium sp.]|nr:class I SAM-dependent methyltransferase [Brumimicrobium sp.]
MSFIDEKIEEYTEEHISKESDVLYELNRKTHLRLANPRMLSGHYQGRLLSMISKFIHPKNILEIGTYTGYSALCLAEGLQKDGQLITLDVNYELEDFIQEYIEKAGMTDKIQLIIGNALEIIPTLSQQFDLVFIDADKANYIHYYNLAIDIIPSGGVIIADNILWSGKVVEEVKSNDSDTKILKEFNKIVQQDERVENILLPIRDGLMIIRKK